VLHPTSGCADARSATDPCFRCDVLLGLDGVHVEHVDRRERLLVVTVSSPAAQTGCPSCGVVATGRGRRHRLLHDVPGMTQVRIVWWQRVWGAVTMMTANGRRSWNSCLRWSASAGRSPRAPSAGRSDSCAGSMPLCTVWPASSARRGRRYGSSQLRGSSGFGRWRPDGARDPRERTCPHSPSGRSHARSRHAQRAAVYRRSHRDDDA